jgi:hypothetical protein
MLLAYVFENVVNYNPRFFIRSSWHCYVNNSKYKASRAGRDILLRLSLAQILPYLVRNAVIAFFLIHSVNVQSEKQK